MNAKTGKGGGGETPLQEPTLPKIAFIEEGRGGGGRASPTPPPAVISKPRLPTPSAVPSPYMNPTATTSSPVLPRKKSPVVAANDPYRHHQQQPPRSFSPAPGARSYTPNPEDDMDSKPLRQDNYQQAYHNRNFQRQYQDPDARSEVGSIVSSHYPPQPQPKFFTAHGRQQSDASILSGSNQGSVVNGGAGGGGYNQYGHGYGQQRPPVKPHPLQQGQVANNINSNRSPYAESVRMSELGQHQQRNPYGGGYPGQARVTGLGGGVGHSSGNGSVVGGGSVVSSGHSYGRPNHGGRQY